MKNTYSIAQRNALVEEHLSCIDALMQSEHKAIRAARLDSDDVYQQLALRLVMAVASFDPEKCELKEHIMVQLRSELQDFLHPAHRFGLTDTPINYGGKVISLEAFQNNAKRREMAMAA